MPLSDSLQTIHFIINQKLLYAYLFHLLASSKFDFQQPALQTMGTRRKTKKNPQPSLPLCSAYCDARGPHFQPEYVQRSSTFPPNTFSSSLPRSLKIACLFNTSNTLQLNKSYHPCKVTSQGDYKGTLY